MSGSTFPTSSTSGQPGAPISGAGDVITTQYGSVAVPTTTNLTRTGTLVTGGTSGGVHPLDGGSGTYYVVDYSVYDPALGDVDIEGASLDGFLPSPSVPTAQQIGASINAASAASNLSYDEAVDVLGFYPANSGSQAQAYGIVTNYANQMYNDGVVSHWTVVATDGDELRMALASLSLTTSNITVCYNCDLNRNPSSSEVASWENRLANNAVSFSGVETGIGDSQEAATDINQSYQNILNRQVDASSLQTDQNALIAGTTTQYIICKSLALSFEAYQDIGNIYGTELGRAVDSGSLTQYQGWLTNGVVTMQYLHYFVAYSQEAGSYIDTFYNYILDRNASSAEIAAWQNDLNNGSLSLGGVRTAIADSAESASDLRLVIQNVQGRQATGNDTPWITGEQAGEAAGTLALNQVTANLANSSGEIPVISNVYSIELGTAPATAQISTEQGALAAGGSIAAYESSLSSSSAGVAVVANSYTDWGQVAPVSWSQTDAEAALANVTQAVIADQSDSATQLQSMAQQFAGLANFNVNSLMIDLGASETQAQDLVASAMTNSYVDEAPDQATVSGLLADGGSTTLNTLIDQAAGVSAAAAVAESGVKGCTNTTQFINTYVTTIDNTSNSGALDTISATNNNSKWNPGLNPLFLNGVRWVSQNANPVLAYRLAAQGTPYENYVTSTLPSSFVQTAAPFPVFDQWSADAAPDQLGVAISDKTLDTQSKSYLASPGRITSLMQKWANAMINFVTSPTMNNVQFTKGQIGEYELYMGVPAATTAPEWTAICAGRQEVVAAFAGQGLNFNIVINQIVPVGT